MDSSLVLKEVKERGPCLPGDIMKNVGGTTFLVGAILSDLVSNKSIKLTYGKIGGSPLYYIDSQKEKLDKLYNYLHEKEQKAYNELKGKKVLRDSEVEPVMRAALRNIKDFAVPLEVNLNNNHEIFWKWYLTENSDAETLIKNMVKVPRNSVNEKEDSRKNVRTLKKESAEEENVKEKAIKEETPKNHKKTSTENFIEDIFSFLQEKDIKIIEQNLIKKNTEIDMTLVVPSPIGGLKYYCKVINKKKCNDKDITSAYAKGQTKRLPTLLTCTGEFTKKAKEMLKTDFQMIKVFSLNGK